MNKIYYIARKIYLGNSEDKKVSQPIIQIARLSIIIAIIVNIITLAVVTGFQKQVKAKVIGFGSHATITRAGEFTTFESAPILYNDSLEQLVSGIKGVKQIQPFAYKPAMLQSDPDTNWYRINEIDTFQVQQEIQGIIVKGVGKTYDWDFFQSNLVEGTIPNVIDSVPHNEIIVSTIVAKNLNLKVGQEVNIFFVKSTPIKLKYKVTGFFKTGLQEFDKQIAIGDIRNVQKLNDWGVQTAIRVSDTLSEDKQFVIVAETQGGNGNYRHNWGQGFGSTFGYTYCPHRDTTFRLISSDFYSFVDGFGELNAIPDTAYLNIFVEGNKNAPCIPIQDEMGDFEKEYLNDDGSKFALNLPDDKRVIFEYIDGKGSFDKYIGGYEVEAYDFSKIEEISQELRRSIYLQDPENQEEYRVQTIVNEHREIFLWLDFMDLNVYIILLLMLLIGAINMGSGLLVLIITKTQLIGLLKALGTKNWDIRKLFLYQSVFIIFRGMIIGNIIGIGFCLLQQHFKLIPLNPEVYYLDAVPIEINILHLLLLNVGTLVLCTAALIVPSYVITKISPIKALKFD